MDTKSNELFWNAEMEEVKNGFTEDSENIKCIICEEEFEKGRIFEINSALYDARKAVEFHIAERHGSMLRYLIHMNSAFTGLSEVQRELLTLISQGVSDKEVAEKLGVAQSTIRNHRYKLREKEKQAKLFLAIMDLISENTDKKINKLDKDVICDAHKTATSLDDRYNITDKEREDIIKTYFGENGELTGYPVKEKRKIIVLKEIAKNFAKGKTYSEKEVNRILKRVYEDYATIRRALIEYGFFARTNDGSSYWIKE
jgi:DNA-binding CsgD family transcriptional regulator